MWGGQKKIRKRRRTHESAASPTFPLHTFENSVFHSGVIFTPAQCRVRSLSAADGRDVRPESLGEKTWYCTVGERFQRVKKISFLVEICWCLEAAAVKKSPLLLGMTISE